MWRGTGAAKAVTETPGRRRLSLSKDGWWMVGLAGLALLAVSAYQMELLDWGAVGIMTALGLATGVFAFRIDERSYASFGSAVFAASVALFGVFVATWVVALTTAILQLVSVRGGMKSASEDIATQVMAVFCAGVVYVLIGGRVAPTQVGAADALRFVVLFAILGVLGAALRSLAGGGARAALASYGRWIGGKGVVIELAMVPLGMLLVVAYSPGEAATFPLLAVVLMVSGAAGKTLWDTKRSLGETVDELRALNALGKDLSSTLRVDVLVELIHEHARTLLGATAVGVTLYDQEKGELDFRVSIGEGEPVLVWQNPMDASLTSWVVRHRSPLLVENVSAASETRRLNARWASELSTREIEPRAWLGVPLVAGDRFVGVLSVQGRDGQPFHESHLELFANIGGQIARAAENARLYEGLELSREAIEQWNRTLEERVEDRTRALETARNELEELNDSLEHRVEERTRELREVQDKIVQSGRLAAVGELAAGVAHELNNPLGGILGYVQLDIERVRKKRGTGMTADETDSLDEHLCLVERQVQRCRSIVGNLLRFSRKSENAFTSVDVNDALRETIDFTGKQLTMRGIEVDTRLDEEIPEVVGDEQQLQQVFANIILNAKDAMPAGGRLQIRTGYDPDTAGRVVLTFADNGKGIREEYLGKVFEPFFTTRDVGQGTGLGLSVSYGIVKDHGGDIDVTSEVGVGSTFTIHLPVGDGAPRQVATDPASEERAC
ncbi:MAG: ATP-binding protein [Candidatus Eisenbacteria bacterium]